MCHQLIIFIITLPFREQTLQTSCVFLQFPRYSNAHIKSQYMAYLKPLSQTSKSKIAQKYLGHDYTNIHYMMCGP